MCSIVRKVPPARQPDGVPQAGDADPARDVDRVLLGGPQRVGRHLLLEPEPLPSGGGVPGPVQPGVVGEDLDGRPDDEGHQEQVEEVLPADPGRDALLAVGRRDGAGVPLDERLHGGQLAKGLGRGDAHYQEGDAERDQPEQVEPAGPPHPHHGGGAPLVRQRTRPRLRVHDVLRAGGQPSAELVEGTRCDSGRPWGPRVVRRSASGRRVAGDHGRTLATDGPVSKRLKSLTPGRTSLAGKSR